MHFPVILAHGALGPYDELIMGERGGDLPDHYGD